MKTLRSWVLIGVCLIAFTSTVRAGIVSPKNGGPLPKQFRELKRIDKNAFTLQHAWIQRRSHQMKGDPRYRLLSFVESAALQDPSRALGGELAIPAVLGLYSDTGEAPFTRDTIDKEIFTGPWTPGTLSEYWSEVSYGLLNVTGTVFDWTTLSQLESYYVGGSFGTEPGDAHVGEMIKEIVDALDPSVDFGLYDNDGPDGVPNSGDDDGFVDVLLVIHPTFGAECDGYSPHIWSHSWTYHSWPVSGGEPYGTNDAAAGGGSIKIDDYIIVPSYSCDNGLNEIGVICHELGHAIGLPDLYDYNGGASGVGYWCLMGAGNWNTAASPAHLCSWSREQLGWLNPIEVGWQPQTIALGAIGTSADAVRIPLPTRRFRRLENAADDYDLVVGHTDAEAWVRNWPGAAGYGNGWHESMYHDFSVNADRPVSLQYDVTIDAEETYDFGRLLIEVNGGVETLAVYTGRASARETMDLDAYLPAGAASFTLRFDFTSDGSYSDEDGYYNSAEGFSFAIDNVKVHGGGVDYSADFELDSGAWRNGSPVAEYFLVDNRRKTGFDANLKGEGMLVWHAENSICYSELGNSGGSSNSETRGLVLEEADGEGNLLLPTYSGGDEGDDGDPYPGSANNRSFGPATIPGSESNDGTSTPVRITGISYGATTSSATFRGGMPVPGIEEVLPDTIDKETDAEAVLDIRGSWMLYGATAYLSLDRDTIRADPVDWRGEERIIAGFPIAGCCSGNWNLSVVSGDGQISTIENAVAITSNYRSAGVTTGRSYFLVEWELKSTSGVRGCLLYRSASGGPYEPVTPDTLKSESGAFAVPDSSVVPETPYSYRIITYMNGGGDDAYALAGPFTIASIYHSAGVTTGRSYFLVEWELKSTSGVRGCLLYRSASGGPYEPVIPDTLKSESGAYSFQDSSVAPGSSYSYRIVTYFSGGGEEIYALDGPFRMPSFPFTADQNYPNPFANETTLSFFQPSAGSVAVDVYDVSGRRVARLANRRFGRGTQTLRWAPAENGAAAGVYFCVFRSGSAAKSIKMIYVP
ncbi:MAG: M6 family metalloprotease domain-containing protein [Candidatus Krumholzibacteria bacterium]|nr:M6 family metalloprotease domain-containing protein [Candidatus Krumholzibacteria bacterium]